MKLLLLLSLLFCGCAQTGTITCREPDIRKCAHEQLGNDIWIWRLQDRPIHLHGGLLLMQPSRIQELIYKVSQGDVGATKILSRAGRRGGQARAAWGHGFTPPAPTKSQLLEQHMNTRDYQHMMSGDDIAKEAFFNELEKISSPLGFVTRAKKTLTKVFNPGTYAERVRAAGSRASDVFGREYKTAVESGTHEQQYSNLMQRARTREGRLSRFQPGMAL